MDFKPMAKMARLSREIIVTEKIDGTNASVTIVPTAEVSILDDPLAVVCGNRSEPGAVTIFAGSRTRWIRPGNDNYGFAAWVLANHTELAKLGPGTHFGEFWGAGIQRRYGLKEKRFSLFNVSRWCYDSLSGGVCEVITDPTGKTSVRGAGPSCCSVVPVLYRGVFNSDIIEACLRQLKETGSVAAPGFSDPEGVIVYHVAAGIGFKKTILNDESPKSQIP